MLLADSHSHGKRNTAVSYQGGISYYISDSHFSLRHVSVTCSGQLKKQGRTTHLASTSERYLPLILPPETGKWIGMQIHREDFAGSVLGAFGHREAESPNEQIMLILHAALTKRDPSPD